jgi:hypothetical protein
MSIVQRAIGILTNPKTEWSRIAAEPATPGGLMTGYALPLALLPLIGTILGALLFASQYAFVGAGIWTFVLISGVIGVIIGLAVLYVMSLIANALAPNFGGISNPLGALKLLVYSGTAVWVAGLLSFIPIIGWMIWIAGFAYAAYLIYIGSTAVMKVPADRAAGYTAVVILIWIALSVVVGFIVTLVMAAVFVGAAVTGGAGYMMR